MNFDRKKNKVLISHGKGRQFCTNLKLVKYLCRTILKISHVTHYIQVKSSMLISSLWLVFKSKLPSKNAKKITVFREMKNQKPKRVMLNKQKLV